MMKKELLKLRLVCVAVIMVLATFNSSAQGNRIANWLEQQRTGKAFQSIEMFTPLPAEPVSAFATEGLIFSINTARLSQLNNSRISALEMNVPYVNKTFTLELVEADISSAMKVGIAGADGDNEVPYSPGIHYRGIIKGDNNSVASVSVFDSEIMIMFSNADGNYVAGKINNNSGNYIIYNDKNVISPPVINCGTAIDRIEPIIEEEEPLPTPDVINCKVVKFYFECDFAMYQAFGSSVTNTVNYATGAINNVITLYANEGITTEISQILVWTVTDPYASFTTTSSVNAAFISQTGANFNGDLAQLLTTRNLGGGIAQGFNGLCNKSQAHATSMIYTTYSPFPTYSWTVMVMTHEYGHLFGSRHTHACVWNGNNTAIDGCSGATEGGCPLPPNPPAGVGGTIMSYCHLTGSGINFNNGFGPQPGGLILGNVNAAVCLTGGNAGTPTGLVTSNITSASALVSWNASAGAVQYIVEYKLSNAANWTQTGALVNTSTTLSGLLAGRSYDWRVNADCSPFSSALNFTTAALPGCGVPTQLSTENITSTTATLQWAPYANAVKYKIRYRVKGTTTWTVSPVFTPNTYSLTGLAALTQYEWQARTKCGTAFGAWSAKTNFTTQSSAPPTGYCASNGNDVSYEYINSATIGTINNTSGSNNGYGNYTGLSTTAAAGSTVSLSVSLWKQISTDLEFVTVFADFNRDADFTDAGETAYSSSSTAATFTGNFTVPLTASIGQTRMRVSMQYSGAPPACGSYTYGEVEDYILNITAGPSPRTESAEYETEEHSSITVIPNPSSDRIIISLKGADDASLISIFDAMGREVYQSVVSGHASLADVSAFEKGIYFVVVKGNNDVLKTSFVKQ